MVFLSSSGERVSCEHCGKNIKKNHLKRHIKRVHNDNQATLVRLCSKVVKKDILRIHKLVHSTFTSNVMLFHQFTYKPVPSIQNMNQSIHEKLRKYKYVGCLLFVVCISCRGQAWSVNWSPEICLC